MKIHASFIVASFNKGFAATTRAEDRGESGKIGLPGGKVDSGETSSEAALREAQEEGWNVKNVNKKPFFVTKVDGKYVAWHKATVVGPLINYKEKGRISPVVASIGSLIKSGYGNDKALKSFKY